MQTQRRDPRLREASENASQRDPGREGSGTLESDPLVNELRKLYDGIVDEPIPDDLLDLLHKLDEVERSR
ncbi:MAG TPA: NepR family anti-sigma factor [Paracoccaceae bacterium]|nr:NepR family anti-sigma factor [Paracoccaceae bacterium]